MNCVGLLSRIGTLKYFLIYSTPPTPISLSIPLAAPNGLQEARERRFKFMSEAPRELESFRKLYPMTWATPTRTRRPLFYPIYQEHSPRAERVGLRRTKGKALGRTLAELTIMLPSKMLIVILCTTLSSSARMRDLPRWIPEHVFLVPAPRYITHTGASKPRHCKDRLSTMIADRRI